MAPDTSQHSQEVVPAISMYVTVVVQRAWRRCRCHLSRLLQELATSETVIKAIEQFGAIDIMIKNAGVTHDTGGMEFDFVGQLLASIFQYGCRERKGRSWCQYGVRSLLVTQAFWLDTSLFN